MARASVGVVEHGNSAILVTVAADATVVDRRRVDLTQQGTPTHPHHHQGSWAVGRYLDSPWAKPCTLEEAVALVERVRVAAERGAREALEVLATEVREAIGTIAIRECPELPPTIEERIRDNRAQTIADTAMYREALAGAARERGWVVHWYDRDRVMREVEDAVLRAMGREVGRPWRAEHRLAAASAIAALRMRGEAG